MACCKKTGTAAFPPSVIHWFHLDCDGWSVPLCAWAFFKAAHCLLQTNRLLKGADGLYLLSLPVELV